MGERKVVNKYIPPDFDPKLVPRGSRPKDDLVPVRMMLPFTIQCGNCSTFLYKGTKFNSKKEPMRGADGQYLGIQRFRFVIKCTACLRPLTFLTDPKNADYEMENGGTRTYEVRKDKERTEDEAAAQETTEEKIDPMKALENRVLASQREMADLDNLEEIKAMNMRNVKLLSGILSSHSSAGVLHAADAVLSIRDKIHEPQRGGIGEDESRIFEEEDELLIKSIQFGMKKGTGGGIHRLDEKDEELADTRRKIDSESLQQQQQQQHQQPAVLSKDPIGTLQKIIPPVVKIKRKRAVLESENIQTEKMDSNKCPVDEKTLEGQGYSLLGLLGDYESD